MLDAIIVGDGVAGLTAALQLARNRLNFAILGAGRPRNCFPKAVNGVLGYDGKPLAALLDQARSQLRNYGVQVTPSTVVDIGCGKNAFECFQEYGEPIQARRILLATGVRDVLPDIPGISERWGTSVLPCPYCHAYELRGKRLGILGLDNASSFMAAFLSSWGDVSFFTTEALQPWASDLLSRRGVQVYHDTVSSVRGPNESELSSVIIQSGAEVPLDALFISPKTELALPNLKLGYGIETVNGRSRIVTDEKRETSVLGFYALGDLTRFGHTVSWAMADGVTAGIAAHQSLIMDPNWPTPQISA